MYEDLKRSIQKNDYLEPIVWNRRTGNIVGGEKRWRILTDLGYTEIDVIPLDIDEVREKEINLALNNIHSTNDDAKLAQLLSELLDVGDLEATGFNEEEANRIIENMNLDIDAFFSALTPKEENQEEQSDEIQCPHCGKWFVPSK